MESASVEGKRKSQGWAEAGSELQRDLRGALSQSYRKF